MIKRKTEQLDLKSEKETAKKKKKQIEKERERDLRIDTIAVLIE